MSRRAAAFVQALARPALLAAALALAALACGPLGPTPTLVPPPATEPASPTPGPETPTPRPAALTQPAATPALPPGSPLPPLAGEAFTRVAAIGSDVPGTVRALRHTPDGTLWLLTDRSVARLAGDTWEVYLPEYEGQLVGLDDLGRVWVAATDGSAIEAWDGEAWQRFGADEGWQPVAPDPQGSVARLGLAADQAGRVWAATAADVRAFDGEHWQVFDRAALGMPSAEAGAASSQFNVAVARDGTVWVTECDLTGPGPAGGGVRWFDGTAWQGAGSPVDQGCGLAFASGTQGAMWVGLNDSLLRYDPSGGEWTTLAAPAAPAGQRFGYVAGLALDQSERPWPLLALCGGAGCDVGFVRFRVDEAGTWLPVGGVTTEPQTVLFDVAGNAWLLGTGGVARAAGDQVQTAGDMRVLGSAQDSGGQIYVAGELAGELALWLVRPDTE